MNEPFFDDDDEFDPAEFIAADEDPLGGAFCQGCGCSEFEPCEGGCVWATPTLCSRCVR